MSKVPAKHPGGRPVGRATFNAQSAKAFGLAARNRRRALGLSQEDAAHQADIERGHYGCIERGENQPSLWLILKISAALGCSSSELLADTQVNLESGSHSVGGALTP